MSETGEKNRQVETIATYHLHHQDNQLFFCCSRTGWQQVLPTKHSKQEIYATFWWSNLQIILVSSTRAYSQLTCPRKFNKLQWREKRRNNTPKPLSCSTKLYMERYLNRVRMTQAKNLVQRR